LSEPARELKTLFSASTLTLGKVKQLLREPNL
jgi:hypothetical protein